jgi:hypothetical protein
MKKAAAPRLPYQPPEPCRRVTVTGDCGSLQASIIHVWQRKDLDDDSGDGPLTQRLMARTLMSASPAFQQVALIYTDRVPMLIAGDGQGGWWDVGGKALTVQG